MSEDPITARSTPRPVLLAWSGGKDCMLALQLLQDSNCWNVVGLLTTLSADGLAHAHFIPSEVLAAQAAALKIPLYQARCSDSSADGYDHAFRKALAEARASHPTLAHIAFGDILLHDVRDWRERHVASMDCSALFPLWGECTRKVAAQIIAAGHRALLISVDTQQLDARFCGRDFDQALLNSLPDGTDPCGENGEFHSLCHDGPCFTVPLRVSLAAPRVQSDGRFATAAVRLS